jgi:hypothetical protein
MRGASLYLDDEPIVVNGDVIIKDMWPTARRNG